MIDKVDLQKIADELEFDLEDVEMLMGVFIESAEESLKVLEIAIADKDYESIFTSAHSIKGSSANLKLIEIYELSKEIEFSAKELKPIDYEDLLNRLKISLDKIR